MKSPRRLAVALLSIAFVSLFLGRSHGPSERATASSSLPPARVDPPNAQRPRVVLGNGSDVRALASDGTHAWAATSGGLDRYDLVTRERVHFGVESGLDTLDVRAVHLVFAFVVVDTAESRCVRAEDAGGAFRCERARPPAPVAPSLETFEGAPVVARVAAKDGALVGTRGRGVFFAPAADASRPVRLDPEENAPASFVRKIVFYKDRAWLGTFDDGLLELPADACALAQKPELTLSATRSRAPVRMVNDLAQANGTLFVAANEGLFFTRDGGAFERLDAIPRGATGIAAFRDHVFVTTTSALWRIKVSGRRPIIDGNWWRPAGTRSLQGVAVSAERAWLASEDRGLIRFDARAASPTFEAVDRLSGAPTSWVVAVASDGRGGAFAATLRDGVFHVSSAGALETVPGAPSAWTLDASFEDDELCVGTQAGAACYADWTKLPTRVFAGLPDARVHDVQHLGPALLLATEAGIAAT
jgi:hypothetical protein